MKRENRRLIFLAVIAAVVMWQLTTWFLDGGIIHLLVGIVVSVVVFGAVSLFVTWVESDKP